MTTKTLLALALALASPLAAQAACDWSHPGVNPYRGDPAAALNDYQLDPAVKQRLQARMARHDYDDIALITAGTLAGKSSYSDLRDMHYGKGQVCRGPVKKTWNPDERQRALIYCDGATCVAVPTVCNNVSLVTREDDKVEPVLTETEFEPTSAGNASEQATGAADAFEPPLPIDTAQSAAEAVACACPCGGGAGGFGPGRFLFPARPVTVPGHPGTPGVPTPIQAVPEPSSAWLLLLGLFPILKRRFT